MKGILAALALLFSINSNASAAYDFVDAAKCYVMTKDYPEVRQYYWNIIPEKAEKLVAQDRMGLKQSYQKIIEMYDKTRAVIPSKEREMICVVAAMSEHIKKNNAK